MNYSRAQIEAASTPAELAAILGAAGSSPRWAARSLTEVAEFFQIAVSTAKGWSQEGMPNTGDGWSLPEIVRWRHARLANTDLATAQKVANLESTKLANDARRLDLSRERGELVDRSDVELWVSQAIICFRETAMSLPDTVATSCPYEIRNFVRSEVDRIIRGALTALRRQLELAELSEQISTTGDVTGDDDEPHKKGIDR